jgi:uncharacterized metal-binding protein
MPLHVHLQWCDPTPEGYPPQHKVRGGEGGTEGAVVGCTVAQVGHTVECHGLEHRTVVRCMVAQRWVDPDVALLAAALGLEKKQDDECNEEAWMEGMSRVMMAPLGAIICCTYTLGFRVSFLNPLRQTIPILLTGDACKNKCDRTTMRANTWSKLEEENSPLVIPVPKPTTRMSCLLFH